MADRLIRSQVTLQNESAIPEDHCTNTWYFDCDDGNTETNCLDVIDGILTTFYVALQDRISDHIVTPLIAKHYDMRDPLPRVPKRTTNIAISRAGVDGLLPNEVALCMSFQAAAASGVNQARRRGRIYIGPLSSTGNLSDTVGECRPSAALLADVAAAGTELLVNHALFSGSAKWAVYSPTTDITQSLDDSFNDVANGWIDNAFDTQRRRGRDATARTLF